MSRGDDIVTLAGTSRRSRLAENLKATELRLGADVLSELDQLFGPEGLAGERYDPQHMHIVAR
jgi:aryl-alcohol dehydrogenase-like predicted oxidoreductase